ncbi:MAG: ribonuclease III [Pseudomonadota bacterium]|nr:ribonuclease III [Pseudomonadota bacterium]
MTSDGPRSEQPRTIARLAVLETRLGHRFADPARLQTALTHASITPDRARSNERLEFLGDRVLGLVVADMLFKQFPDEEEGDLGYRYTALVRRESLARVAVEIGLSDYISMSDGEREAGGAEKEGLLANACEAVIGALYLDNGLDGAAHFITENWRALMNKDATPPKDPKTELQEWTQADGKDLPRYEVNDRIGPHHAPVFTVTVSVEGLKPEAASGASKRSAEQAAAQALLSRVKKSSDD